jgi:hypothetical protein
MLSNGYCHGWLRTLPPWKSKLDYTDVSDAAVVIPLVRNPLIYDGAVHATARFTATQPPWLYIPRSMMTGGTLHSKTNGAPCSVRPEKPQHNQT